MGAVESESSSQIPGPIETQGQERRICCGPFPLCGGLCVQLPSASWYTFPCNSSLRHWLNKILHFNLGSARHCYLFIRVACRVLRPPGVRTNP